MSQSSSSSSSSGSAEHEDNVGDAVKNLIDAGKKSDSEDEVDEDEDAEDEGGILFGTLAEVEEAMKRARGEKTLKGYERAVAAMKRWCIKHKNK